jgi:D-alanine-D-alanine ligase
MNRKLRVGVIFGGRSGEHEVSLRSAQSVMAALDRAKYEVVPVGITRSGRWLRGDAMQALISGDETAVQPAPILPYAADNAASYDVIIPVLHGPYGEDGTVQGLLQLAGIPYVGAGVAGSAVGMDKALFKSVMQAHDIPILPWRLLLAAQWRANREQIVAELEAQLRYPMFTKPANLGSSVGISKCRDRAELIAGLDEAARFDRRLVVEQGIDGRELEIAVLGNDNPQASVVGEVRPRRDFYDYVAKYVSDDSELIIPAELSPETADAARALALRAYQAIDCAGLGRVDLLMDKADGRLYLNEINTMPGFTSISMYPKLWEASGLSYPALLDKLIELALERYETIANLETTADI